MTIGRTTVFAAAALLSLGVATATAQSGAALDRSFAQAVERVLRNVDNPFFDGLSSAEMNEFIACAQTVMNNAPAGRKRYVLEVTSLSEQMARFDEIAQDNHAALKQQITSDCA